MVNINKKYAFTIAESLICMLILSIFIAVSMKVFTKKHQKPTYNAAHGYYMCYRDANGNIMKKIGAAAPTGPYDDGCDFQPVKSANYYVVYAVGGGGGGGVSNNTQYGGAPGSFTTLFLTNIADTLKIIPGLGGKYNENGSNTIIQNNNPDDSADKDVLVAMGGLKGGESRIRKNYVRSCKAVPINSLLTGSNVNYFKNNWTDQTSCEVNESNVTAKLCSHSYEDVYQYNEIYENNNSFYKTYKKDAEQSISEAGLKNIFNDNNHRYAYEGNCLIRYSNAHTHSKSYSDYKYCLNGDSPDKLYASTYSDWYLVGQNSNKTAKCLSKTVYYSDSVLNIDDNKDSELVVRNAGDFKFILDLYYDLTKRNVTPYIKESGFGDYLINSSLKDKTTEVLYHPEARSYTNPNKPFDPSAGDGGHKDGSGFSGAVFIAW